MVITFEQMIRLPVVTVSGQRLGHIFDIEIDSELHSVRKYLVKQGVINKEEYLVAPLQIKRITAAEIIVEDGVLTNQSMAAEKTRPPETLGSIANTKNI